MRTVRKGFAALDLNLLDETKIRILNMPKEEEVEIAHILRMQN
jgi:hypothetical protein